MNDAERLRSALIEQVTGKLKEQVQSQGTQSGSAVVTGAQAEQAVSNEQQRIDEQKQRANERALEKQVREAEERAAAARGTQETTQVQSTLQTSEDAFEQSVYTQINSTNERRLLEAQERSQRLESLLDTGFQDTAGVKALQAELAKEKADQEKENARQLKAAETDLRRKGGFRFESENVDTILSDVRIKQEGELDELTALYSGKIAQVEQDLRDENYEKLEDTRAEINDIEDKINKNLLEQVDALHAARKRKQDEAQRAINFQKSQMEIDDMNAENLIYSVNLTGDPRADAQKVNQLIESNPFISAGAFTRAYNERKENMIELQTKQQGLENAQLLASVRNLDILKKRNELAGGGSPEQTTSGYLSNFGVTTSGLTKDQRTEMGKYLASDNYQVEEGQAIGNFVSDFVFEEYEATGNYGLAAIQQAASNIAKNGGNAADLKTMIPQDVDPASQEILNSVADNLMDTVSMFDMPELQTAGSTAIGIVDDSQINSIVSQAKTQLDASVGSQESLAHAVQRRPDLITVAVKEHLESVKQDFSGGNNSLNILNLGGGTSGSSAVTIDN